MKFGIITPTYNRYDLLKRSINSVLEQTYNNFELIIVDDSTNNKTFENFKKDFNDNKIKYIKNKKNSGVNFSRNIGLDNLSNDVDFVLFLDDDDYFDRNTLIEAKNIINLNPDKNWFLSNRLNITKIDSYNKVYNYLNDYMFGYKIYGDATHCIKKDIIGNIRFSKRIRQAQEWLFYIELGEKTNIYTYDFNSTISEYLDGGLTSGKGLKVFLGKFYGVLEFIFFRKVSLKTKNNFIKRVLGF